MTFIHAIILGIVEGVTEFLPISSTAHLMMTSRLLGLADGEFLKSFEIIIQLGAVLAIVLMFGRDLIKNTSLWKKIIIAFIPTAVIGFALYKLIKTYLIGNIAVALLSLVVGGIVLIVVEKYLAKKHGLTTSFEGSNVNEISNKEAFWIGAAQSLAVIPGISRSAATIVSALFFGASRRAAAEFSFLLAVPTVAAAAGYDLLKNIHVLTSNDHVPVLAVGFVVSFVAALFSIKFMLSYIQRHSFSFVSFGVYRIIAAILFVIIVRFM